MKSLINRLFKIATQILRTMFGFTIKYIDWSDFIINCLEIPYPDINDLLDLKNQYMTLEKEKIKNQNHLEGITECSLFFFFYVCIYFIYIFRYHR